MGEMGAAAAILQLLGKWYLQAADEAPAVVGPVLTMLWEGVQSSQQVIVTVILGSCHPIISWFEVFFRFSIFLMDTWLGVEGFDCIVNELD